MLVDFVRRRAIKGVNELVKGHVSSVRIEGSKNIPEACSVHFAHFNVFVIKSRDESLPWIAGDGKCERPGFAIQEFFGLSCLCLFVSFGDVGALAVERSEVQPNFWIRYDGPDEEVLLQ